MPRSILTRSPILSSRWEAPPSDHFDGRRFVNRPAIGHHGLRDLLRWQASRESGPWTRRRDNPRFARPPHRVPHGFRVTFVGHATCLVQLDGLNVLTDPVFAERLGPVSFAGPRRYRPPGLPLDDLPPIDLVLLSHNHYDHLCEASIRALARDHGAVVACGLGNRALLEHYGVREVIEMDWWDEKQVSETHRIRFVPAQHFSGRGLTDRDATLWGGFVLEGPSGRLYFAGDTGMGPHFEAIRERCGAPHVALLPIGAFRPEWFMHPVHVNPAEAVEAAVTLGAHINVAIHFGTFRLADDGQDEPAEKLEAACAALETPPTFWVLGEGEGRDVEIDRGAARHASSG